MKSSSLTILTPNQNKRVAIFGAGRTGIAIALALVKLKLGYYVDLYDVKEVAIPKNDYLRFIKLDEKVDMRRDQFRLECLRLGSYFNILHSYLYNEEQAREFVYMVEGCTEGISIIGTILTTLRQQEVGIITENTPRLTEENIYDNGGYAANKRRVEFYFENLKLDIPVAIYRTFHILDDYFLPGVTPPYFRNENLISILKHRTITLPDKGDILYQVTDNQDLARIIALGIRKNLDGIFNVLGEKVVSSAEYYEFMSDELGFGELRIENLPIDNVADSQMTLYDWVVDTKLISNRVEDVVQKIPWENSLRKSILYLNRGKFGVGESIFSKMNKKPFPKISEFRKIGGLR